MNTNTVKLYQVVQISEHLGETTYIKWFTSQEEAIKYKEMLQETYPNDTIKCDEEPYSIELTDEGICKFLNDHAFYL